MNVQYKIERHNVNIKKCEYNNCPYHNRKYRVYVDNAIILTFPSNRGLAAVLQQVRKHLR